MVDHPSAPPRPGTLGPPFLIVVMYSLYFSLFFSSLGFHILVSTQVHSVFDLMRE